MCSYVATQIGFGSSWMNPFSLAVAQGVAGIPVMSGAGFRIVLWVIFTATAIIFTMRYAVKIKRTRSLPWHMKPISITAMIFHRKIRKMCRLLSVIS